MKLLKNRKGVAAQDTGFTVALVVASVAVLGILFSKTILSWTGGKPVGILLQIFLFIIFTVVVILTLVKKEDKKPMDYIVPILLIVGIYYALYMIFPKIIPQAFDAQSIVNMKVGVEQSLVSFFG